MKFSSIHFFHKFIGATLCALAAAFACASNAAEAETKKSANVPKCCCLASFGDGFVADEADWPIQPAAMPKYPEAALAGHWSARVLVYLSVDLAGAPKSMRVQKVDLSGGPKSSPGMAKEEESIRHAFEAETLQAARQWRFKDCSEYGWPTARSTEIPVDFHWSEEADKPATENKTPTKR